MLFLKYFITQLQAASLSLVKPFVSIFCISFVAVLLSCGGPSVDTRSTDTSEASDEKEACAEDSILITQSDVATKSKLFAATPDLSASYCLKQNIVLPEQFTGIKGTFNGDFNGNGLPLTVASFAEASEGIFSTIGKAANIRNLVVVVTKAVEFSPSSPSAVLAGTNKGTLTAISITGAQITVKQGVSVTEESAFGALVGTNKGTINTSYATTIVKGIQNTGGLVGKNEGTISDSYTNANVTGKNNVGGLVGENNGIIRSSYANGNVEGTNNAAGGLVGKTGVNGTITASYATGNVSGNLETGGLIGSYFNPTETTIEKIVDSYATGSVTGNNHTGGLLGHNKHGILIASSYAHGDVTGPGVIGGLIGTNAGGIITNVYATGEVSATNPSERLGGLIGSNSGKVSHAIATGSIAASATKSTGGLIGWNSGELTYTAATGTISGAANHGGLIGYNHNNATVTHSFFNAKTQLPAIGGVPASSDPDNVKGSDIETLTAEDNTLSSFDHEGWDSPFWKQQLQSGIPGLPEAIKIRVMTDTNQ